MRSILSVLGCLVLAQLGVASDPVPKPGSRDLTREFQQTIKPFLQANCNSCHNADKPKGGLDLTSYDTIASIGKDFRRWELVHEQIRAKTMPPEKAKPQPTTAERQVVIEWLRAVRQVEAVRTAGDPGIVPARRLSNAEYDNTIRDLTGVDLRPTKEFPVDPANEVGFDNTAESLTMSPALVKKYLQAARTVADHVVLKPSGFTFAEFPMLADTDRDKYCVRQVIDFYKRHKTDYADYFQAAWRFQHRAALGQPNATLADVATQANISAKYLTTIWTVLQSTDEVGPLAAIRETWKQLPAPQDGKEPAAVRAHCVSLRDFVTQLRKQLTPTVSNLRSPGMSDGSQPLILWKNREQAANRMRYTGGALKLQLTNLSTTPASVKALTPPTDPAAIAKYEATFPRFCETFPDVFLISERARAYLDPEKEKSNAGRLLNAGFHSMTGYFRDDEPLYKLVLNETEQKELDRLWREFDFITAAPIRQYTSFIWYEHAESSFIREAKFDSFRAEDKDVTSNAKMKQLAELFLDKVKQRGGKEVALKAVADHFKIASDNIRRVETDRLNAEPTQIKALQDFAAKAFRRPLSDAERDRIVAFYKMLRTDDGLTHEEAIRDSIVSILMSPYFCFQTSNTKAEPGVKPLADLDLANRLSYFLWASMPDSELLSKAQSGELHKPEVVLAQVRRMMKDSRSRGFATEFAGNWLDVRRFEEHNGVDRDRFPTFTNDLRQAMFEELIQFFLDVAKTDRSILDFLYADHTFVNRTLAKHYGIPQPTTTEWVRIDHASQYGRGGILPMAVFMTKNAPGLRTSPVKRGYWVVRKILGETIPAPPTTVPELPNDESKLELPLREMLARHRADRSCAQCHDRFDGFGLSFEGFGPVGERRVVDLGGKPVQTKAAFLDNSERVGVEGLQRYIREQRQDDFIDNLCRKLLSYALGRSLIPGDDLLIAEMKAKLAANGYRFSVIVDSIVLSPQFMTRRNPTDPAKGTQP